MTSTSAERVLHVVESFGGGTLSALRQYMASTPDLEHFVIRRERDGEFSPADEDKFVLRTFDLPTNPLHAMRSIRRAAREVEPDVIHAHSSIGGALARLSLKSSRSRRIVYTPHCFAFERQDISRLRRAVFRAIEWTLAINTHTLAGCSHRESDVARSWVTCRRSVYVPNVATVRPSNDGGQIVDVVAVGRLSPQKDPAFFADVVQRLSELSPGATWRWLGDGDRTARRQLESRGVEVSGWLTPAGVQRQLAAARVYVHCARWEGFPMTILEAHISRTPIVARQIPALSGIGPSLVGTTAAEIAEKVASVLASPAAASSNLLAWDRHLAENTRTTQRERLLMAYG